MEHLRVGDPCQECLAQGRDHKLRLFYLNLDEEQLLKCEARTCLWPHNDEVSSDEEVEVDFETSDTLAPLESLLPAPKQSLPSLLEDLPADPPTNASWKESTIPFNDPVAVDDDEFIRQLLQQLTSATETDSDKAEGDPKLNINSLPDLEKPVEEKAEVKPCLELQLPDLSCLDVSNPEQINKPQKDSTVKEEISLLPAKIVPLPKLKAQRRQSNPKAQLPSRQEPEIPLQPAKLMSPKGESLFTTPQKASTLPRSPTAAVAQPAFNIIISIPEINPTKSFMDAINRHSASAKPASRGGGKTTTRPSIGRRPRAQAVMQMIQQMETNADAKRTS